MYVSQVAQFSKYTAPTVAKVPLVAGRQAELRVFLVTASTTGPLVPMPTVRVKLNGALLANLAPPSPNPFPSGLPRSLSNSDEIAPLIVTLVPLSTSGKTGSTTDVGTDLVTKYWPFPSASYPVRSSLAIGLSSSNSASDNDSLILNQLEVARFADGLSGYYYGLLPDPPEGTAVDCGASFGGIYQNTAATKRSAFGADNNAYQTICPTTIGDEHHVMPHELAHAFSLDHAPCGGASDPDPWFSQHNAASGNMVSDGWDFSNSTVPNGQATSDIMGYCSTYWVGAYDWSKVLAFFQTGPPPNQPNPTPPPSRDLAPLPKNQQAIHVFAIVKPRTIEIVASFTDFGSPFHGVEHGPVKMVGLDAAGSVLFTADGALSKHPSDSSGSSEITVVLSDEQVSRLSQLRVSYNDVSVTQRSLPFAQPSISAVAIDANNVKVTFDGRHFGLVTVRGSATERAPSFPLYGIDGANSGGIVEVSSPDIYCDFTDGIKTVATRVKVHVQGR